MRFHEENFGLVWSAMLLFCSYKVLLFSAHRPELLLICFIHHLNQWLRSFRFPWKEVNRPKAITVQ